MRHKFWNCTFIQWRGKSFRDIYRSRESWTAAAGITALRQYRATKISDYIRVMDEACIPYCIIGYDGLMMYNKYNTAGCSGGEDLHLVVDEPERVGQVLINAGYVLKPGQYFSIKLWELQHRYGPPAKFDLYNDLVPSERSDARMMEQTTTHVVLCRASEYGLELPLSTHGFPTNVPTLSQLLDCYLAKAVEPHHSEAYLLYLRLMLRGCYLDYPAIRDIGFAKRLSIDNRQLHFDLLSSDEARDNLGLGTFGIRYRTLRDSIRQGSFVPLGPSNVDLFQDILSVLLQKRRWREVGVFYED